MLFVDWFVGLSVGLLKNYSLDFLQTLVEDGSWSRTDPIIWDLGEGTDPGKFFFFFLLSLTSFQK